MRIAGLVVLIASACGPVAATAKHPPAATPPPPAYQVAKSSNLAAVAADATHVYWTDGGIHRMEHGPGHTAERLFASDAYIYDLAIGDHDVFFMDDAMVLRVLPKAGGAPTELHTFEGALWGIAADGDAVWVGVDDRLERWSRDAGEKKVKLPGGGTRVVIADGVAYVTGYDKPTLVSVELATGKITTLSDEWYFGDSQGLTVSGKSVLSAYSEGVAAVPRAGGAPKLVFPTAVGNLVGDAGGYVALGYGALIEHHSGHPPQVLALSRSNAYLAATRALALGGGYVYHVDSDDVGTYMLNATPRGTGATMMRLPLGAYVSSVAASGNTLYATMEDERGQHIARIGERRTQGIADTGGYVEAFTAGEDALAYFQDGTLTTITLPGRQSVSYPNEIAGGFGLTVHKGRVYSSSYGQIYTTKIGMPGSTRLVADVTAIPGVAGDVQIAAMRFAHDHLYFSLPYAGMQGLGRIDEEGHSEIVWTYPEQYSATLQPDFTIIGDVAYMHDETHVYAVPLDGGKEARTLAQHDSVQVIGLYRAGNHLIARLYTPQGEVVVELSRRTGKVRTLWRGGLNDGGYPNYFAVGDDAIYVYSGELYSILKIAV